MANISYPQLIHNIGVAIKEKAGLDNLKYGEMEEAIRSMGGGSGYIYASIVDNGDNTITAIDKDGVEHTIAYSLDDDGKIVSVSLDGKLQTVTYDDNNILTKINNTNVNIEYVPILENETSPLIESYSTSYPPLIQVVSGDYFKPSVSSSDYCHGTLRTKNSPNTDLSFDVSTATTSWRICLKFKLDSISSYWSVFCGNSSNQQRYPIIGINPSTHKLYMQTENPRGSYPSFYCIDTEILPTVWYYVVMSQNIDLNYSFLSIYDESGTLLDVAAKTIPMCIYSQAPFKLGGHSVSNAQLSNSHIDLNECFIELDENILWGQTNNKTQNMGIFDIDYTDFTKFQQVEYIESTGTQYINTGVYGASDLGIEVGFSPKSIGSVFGATPSASTEYYGLNLHDTNKFEVYWGSGSNVPKFGAYILNQKYNVSFNYMKSDKVNINDTDLITLSEIGNTEVFSDVYPIFLFRLSGAFTQEIKAQISNCKISKDSVVIRDFKPCYHKITKEVGLFDVINNVFYGNDGTGTFTKGKDIIE